MVKINSIDPVPVNSHRILTQNIFFSHPAHSDFTTMYMVDSTADFYDRAFSCAVRIGCIQRCTVAHNIIAEYNNMPGTAGTYGVYNGTVRH